jgi:hypothetical protein
LQPSPLFLRFRSASPAAISHHVWCTCVAPTSYLACQTHVADCSKSAHHVGDAGALHDRYRPRLRSSRLAGCLSPRTKSLMSCATTKPHGLALGARGSALRLGPSPREGLAGANKMCNPPAAIAEQDGPSSRDGQTLRRHPPPNRPLFRATLDSLDGWDVPFFSSMFRILSALPVCTCCTTWPHVKSGDGRASVASVGWNHLQTPLAGWWGWWCAIGGGFFVADASEMSSSGEGTS